MGILPMKLRYQLVNESRGAWLMTSPLFISWHEKELRSFHRLCWEGVKHEHCNADDLVFSTSEPCEAMRVICSGSFMYSFCTGVIFERILKHINGCVSRAMVKQAISLKPEIR